jgi:hypothetical protein
MTPTCPRCGSEDGTLGTSYAYFMCRSCNHGQPVYWTKDHQHPGEWDKAIAASPWACVRRALELIKPFRPQPTMEECAEILSTPPPGEWPKVDRTIRGLSMFGRLGAPRKPPVFHLGDLDEGETAGAKIARLIASDDTPFTCHNDRQMCRWCESEWPKPDWRLDPQPSFFGHPKNDCLVWQSAIGDKNG